MELKFIKEVVILSCRFKVIYDKKTDAGEFMWGEKDIITIGIKNYKNNPEYTISILTHELMELILSMIGARYSHSRIDNNYLFNYDHQTFENSIQVFTETFNKFIK